MSLRRAPRVLDMSTIGGSEQNPAADIEPPVPETQSIPNGKPTVISIYGIQGAGKSTLIKRLESSLAGKNFDFYDSSKEIEALIPDGGLKAFKALGEEKKNHYRKIAIEKIRDKCAARGNVGIVAGHLLFWDEGKDEPPHVCTDADLQTYTHMIYLGIPVDRIYEWRQLDNTRPDRKPASKSHLKKWQDAEKTVLRELCLENGILFSCVSRTETLEIDVWKLLDDFRRHTEAYNLSQAEGRLDDIIRDGNSKVNKMIVLDADKTLTAVDTGAMLFKEASKIREWWGGDCPLKKLFERFGSKVEYSEYSYTAFRQATLMHEELYDEGELGIDRLCQDVASKVVMYPEFVSLLQLVSEREAIGAVIITCGFRRLWEKVLERAGLSGSVEVIAGGLISDKFVVTPEVKAALVERLQTHHQMEVWAFGDSKLDLGMLLKADKAMVVVGHEKDRSGSMEAALKDAIDNQSLRAHQVLLPSNALPRLDTTKLPLIRLTDGGFVNSILGGPFSPAAIAPHHATEKKAAQLLMTPTRDANNAGPSLREAHRRVGWYLATEFLTDLIGLEKYSIPHVQGKSVWGNRLLHEKQTTIVALMRGGEPMAFGVNDAFPLAMFLHADDHQDIKNHHLEGRLTVVLVDSVINSGKTVVDFVRHIRNLNALIHIVVVAGVIQREFASKGSLAEFGPGKVSVVALRISDNKFTGKGTTDTGNRLFNTTHLD